jgi:predicted DCC family thiol-disulfide oxidoreductase YuxK
MTNKISIVYFDGTCGVCDQTVNLLMRLDRAQCLAFAPLQGETARRALPDELRVNPQSVVLSEGTAIYRESSAVVRILWRLSGLWKAVAVLLWLVPAPLRDALYRLVARNRYRILGTKTVCRLPTPEQAKQLLP